MSMATALSSPSTGGCTYSTRSLRYISSAAHQSSAHRCSGWLEANLHLPTRPSNAKPLPSNSLTANWNGLVYKGLLSRQGVADYRKLSKFVCGSPVALCRPCVVPSLIHSVSKSTPRRGGRLVQSLESHSFSALPILTAASSKTLSKSRIAYGYYLGPVYGYGGGVGFGGGSIFLVLVLGFLAVQAFTRTSEDGDFTRTREKVSVLKLQVGLLGIARNLQRDLERIADHADTSTTRGLHYVLTETVLALLRQPDMCILGTSSTDFKRSVEAGERRFNQLSLEERGKFDEETLVNVDGNRKNIDRGRSDGFGNEYIVVTVLVAAEGEYKLPAIYSNSDMIEALKMLGSIPADRLQGVEILWTPQDKNDTLTERDLLRNYPLLKSL